jgi:hypothetical protein
MRYRQYTESIFHINVAAEGMVRRARFEISRSWQCLSQLKPKSIRKLTELNLWFTGLIAGIVIIAFILLLFPEDRRNVSSQTSVPSAQARYSDTAPQASNLGAVKGMGMGGNNLFQ